MDLRLTWLTLMKDSTWLWLGIHNLRLDLDLTQMTRKSWLFFLSFFFAHIETLVVFFASATDAVHASLGDFAQRHYFKCRRALRALTTQHNIVLAHIRCDTLVFSCTSAMDLLLPKVLCLCLPCCFSQSSALFERRRSCLRKDVASEM